MTDSFIVESSFWILALFSDISVELLTPPVGLWGGIILVLFISDFGLIIPLSLTPSYIVVALSTSLIPLILSLLNFFSISVYCSYYYFIDWSLVDCPTDPVSFPPASGDLSPIGINYPSSIDCWPWLLPRPMWCFWSFCFFTSIIEVLE